MPLFTTHLRNNLYRMLFLYPRGGAGQRPLLPPSLGTCLGCGNGCLEGWWSNFRGCRGTSWTAPDGAPLDRSHGTPAPRAPHRPRGPFGRQPRREMGCHWLSQSILNIGEVEVEGKGLEIGGWGVGGVRESRDGIMLTYFGQHQGLCLTVIRYFPCEFPAQTL